MRKYIFLLLIATLGTLLSCESDGKKEFLDEYDSIVFFLNNGEQKYPLYRVGEPTVLSFNISKTGSNYKATASVEVVVLTQEELDIYNEANGTSYKVMPEECYDLVSNTKLNFTSAESYLFFDVSYETSKIDLLEGSNYVHALKLTSSTTKINTNKDLLIVKPYVEDAFLYFDNLGTNRIIIEDDVQRILAYKIQVKHNFENKWNFSSIIGVNKDLFKAFNEENNVNYLMVPDGAYTIKNDGVIDFIADENYGDINLEIDGSKIIYGNYLLPLSILEVSREEIKIDSNRKNNVWILSYAPNESKLSPINLSIGMLLTNAQEPSEGPINNLLDGDVSTFFHSAWSFTVDGDHYLQVNLDQVLSAFNFQYTTRHNNNSGNPAKIILQGSIDGVNFFNIETIDKGLPTGTSQQYKSHVIVTAPAKFLRFVVPANRSGGKFFTMSEFSLGGLL